MVALGSLALRPCLSTSLPFQYFHLLLCLLHYFLITAIITFSSHKIVTNRYFFARCSDKIELIYHLSKEVLIFIYFIKICTVLLHRNSGVSGDDLQVIGRIYHNPLPPINIIDFIPGMISNYIFWCITLD
jgi:hypothetical protein